MLYSVDCDANDICRDEEMKGWLRWFRFKTTRMVREGEELFFDYYELGQDASSLDD